MNARHWLNRWFGRKTTDRIFRRLHLEPLEQRSMLAALVVDDLAEPPNYNIDGGTNVYAGYGARPIGVSGSTVYYSDGVSLGLKSQLWKTNGSTGGNTLVRDLAAGTSNQSWSIFGLTPFAGSTYFLANHRFPTALDSQLEMWKTDGTSAGTTLVQVISQNITAPQGDAFLTVIGGSMYFASDDSILKTDGTSAGTALVKQFVNGAPASSWNGPKDLINVSGTLYFSADETGTGRELWKSDGTPGGTVLVKDIYPGAAGSEASGLANMNGVVYFAANDNVHGPELWKSDGTSAGTTLVADINVGVVGSSPAYFTNVNGTLFFAASQPGIGCELYKSDGTSAGTVLAADINQSVVPMFDENPSSAPTQLVAVGDDLYFRADPRFGAWSYVPGYHGAAQLYHINGDGTGLEVVQVTSTGAAPDPFNMIPAGNKLYLTGYDPNVAQALFALPLGDTLTVTGTASDDSMSIVFTTPTDYSVVVNGVVNFYTTAQYSNIVVDALGGNNSMVIVAPTGSDQLGLTPSGGTLNGFTYSMSLANTEFKYVYGGADDVALLDGSAGSDYFYGLPQYATMTDAGATYFSQTIGFGKSTGQLSFATAGAADYALLFGSASNDTFTTATYGGNVSTLVTPTTTSIAAGTWAGVYAFGQGGADVATMFLRAGTFYGLPGYSMSIEEGVLQESVGFVQVTGIAALPISTAILFDSGGDDTMTASIVDGRTVARLTGAGFDNTAYYFNSNYGIASNGGNDTATLQGAADGTVDTFYGYETYAALLNASLTLQAQGFDLVHSLLPAKNDGDIANLFDSSGNDQLAASGNMAELTYAAGNRVRVSGFHTVYAYGFNGGTNTKNVINPLDYALSLLGSWI